MTKGDRPAAGLDVFADFLIGPMGGHKDPNKDDNAADDSFQDIDPDDLKKQMDSDNDNDDGQTKQIAGGDTGQGSKDDKGTAGDSDIDDDNDDGSGDDDQKKGEKDASKDDKTSESDEYESEISSFFAGRLMEKLGVEDVDDIKIEKIDDVLGLMNEIITENSVPTYATEEVEKFDEFVRNGGSLRSFYDEVHASKINVDALDAENEHDQRSIIRENLLNQGYKEEKIKKMLSRYEENETLKEEAEDALDLVKEFNQRKADSLLVEQKNKAKEVQKMQQKFYSDVNSNIKQMSHVRGIPITEKDKRELLRYAFETDDEGLSKMQKDSRDVNNILEMAYLLMNKDKKIDNVKKSDTDAYKILREKLRARGTKVEDDNQKGKTSNTSLGDFGKGILFN